MIELRDDKTFVIPEGTTREELIDHMKKYGIRVKCFPVFSTSEFLYFRSIDNLIF